MTWRRVREVGGTAEVGRGGGGTVYRLPQQMVPIRVALPSDYNLPGGNVTSLISSW